MPPISPTALWNQPTSHIIDEINTLKVLMVLLADYNHPDGDQLQEFNFKTTSNTLHSGDSHTIKEFRQKEFSNIVAKEYAQQDWNSGWSRQSPLSLNIKISKFKLNKTFRHIDFPKKNKNINAINNVQNKDEFCIKYSMLCKHLPNTGSILNEHSVEDLSSPYSFNSLLFPLNPKKI